MRLLISAFFPLVLLSSGVRALEEKAADGKMLRFAKAFNERDLPANEKRPELAWFVRHQDRGRDFVKDTYNDSRDLKIRKAALYLFCKGWPTRCEGRLANAEHSKDLALRNFGRRLRDYLRGIQPAEKLPLLSTCLKNPPKKNETFLAVLAKALRGKDEAQADLALRIAEQHAKRLFKSDAWPLLAARILAQAPPVPPARAAKLTAHLLKNEKRVPAKTRARMAKLLKRDIFDVLGNRVAAWSEEKEKKKGYQALAEALRAAASGKDSARLIGLLDAIRRRGARIHLPLAAPFLDSNKKKVAKAALGVFKVHARGWGPDTRTPQACFVWWTMEGRKHFKW